MTADVLEHVPFSVVGNQALDVYRFLKDRLLQAGQLVHLRLIRLNPTIRRK
ncbi:MAG: hypothetical protein NWE83_02455 [Candidatus Bathyarchaeota archaeon]|nr:hypothetical protein [Candidatus Bathyarchaeota archaeon]